MLAGFLLIAGLSLIPGAMGTLGITMLSIPSDESDQTWISGIAEDVVPADFAVVVYIKVGSAWWGPKPTFASPLTTIRTDGFWDAVFVTGGYDDEATQFAVYLIPRDAARAGSSLW